MKAYAQYKASGAAWLGEVPKHWAVERLRFRAKLNPGASRPLLDTEVVSFLPMDAIGDDGELALEQFRSVGDVSSGYTYFEDGDVAMAKITPCYENGKGAVMRGLRGGVGFGTTELIVMRPQDVVVPRWLYYLTMCDVFRVPGEAMMLGAGGQKRVPDLFVKDYYAAFPPLSEQEAIADYLHAETARIDNLIREKEGLIGLLHEWRHSTIATAVTKGLTPEASLRPSGDPWLGDVPEHWTVSRLRFHAAFNPGPSRILRCDESVSFVPMEAIGEDGTVDLSRSRLAGDLASGDTYFEDGDVVLAKITPCFENGKGAVMRGLRGGVGFGTTELIVIRPSEGLVAEWLYYLTMCRGFRAPGEAMMLGAGGQKRVPDLFVKDYIAAVPPTHEQHLVVAYLGVALKHIDELVQHAKAEIDLLKELRTATIADAVLGRIDVRTAKQPH